MADEEKKEGISTKLFGKRKKQEEPIETETKVMEEPPAMMMEEPPLETPNVALKELKKPLSKLAGHPVARRKHRSILNQRPIEARKYLNTK